MTPLSPHPPDRRRARRAATTVLALAASTAVLGAVAVVLQPRPAAACHDFVDYCQPEDHEPGPATTLPPTTSPPDEHTSPPATTEPAPSAPAPTTTTTAPPPDPTDVAVGVLGETGLPVDQIQTALRRAVGCPSTGDLDPECQSLVNEQAVFEFGPDGLANRLADGYADGIARSFSDPDEAERTRQALRRVQLIRGLANMETPDGEPVLPTLAALTGSSALSRTIGRGLAAHVKQDDPDPLEAALRIWCVGGALDVPGAAGLEEC